MRISIKGERVEIHDKGDNLVCMTTEQLIEIVKLLNLSITSEGDFRFNCLEFCV